jgi:hypothetical protein
VLAELENEGIETELIQLSGAKIHRTAIGTLVLDENAADRAAQVRGSLERAGASIGMADSPPVSTMGMIRPSDWSGGPDSNP